MDRLWTLARASLALAIVVGVGCGGGGSGAGGDARPGGDDGGPRVDGGVSGDGGGGDGGGGDGGIPDAVDGPPIVVPVDVDRDDDGIPDLDDAFPDDPGEMFDDDTDGVGNVADPDEDGDGVLDGLDPFPFDPALTALPVSPEIEPNPTALLATIVTGTLPRRLTGTFPAAGDVDRFRLTVPADTPLGLVVTTTGLADGVAVELWSGIRPLAAMPAVAAPGTRAMSAVHVLTAGEYDLVVRSTGGPAAVSYTVDVLLDADLDGLGDGPERALGIHPGRPDTDGDRILDRFEAAFTGTGLDADALPTWLDLDSDGDGLSDTLEGLTDDDLDGLPSFVDANSDGEGVNDASEPGALGLELPDTDGDGVPDYRSPDDDGDGLLDHNDPAPGVPAASGTGDVLGARLLVSGASALLSGGQRIPATAIEGETLVIDGTSFGATPGANVIILAGGARTLNLTPTSASATELRVVVPAGAGGRLAVAAGGFVSPWFDVTPLRATDPVLYPLAGTVLYDSFFWIDGRNLAAVNAIDHGGRLAPIVAGDATATSVATGVSISYPRSVQRARVRAGGRWSNWIPVIALGGRYIDTTLPAGTSLTGVTLTYEADGVTRVAPPPYDGDSPLGSLDRPVLVSALAPVGPAGADCLVLQGFGMPGRDTMEISAESTAVAFGLIAARAEQKVVPIYLVNARDLIAALPAAGAFAAELVRALGDDPCALTNGTDVALMNALVDLTVASEAAIDGALGSATLPERLFRVYNPTITPMEASDVLIRGIAGGNIALENDSGLYLSAKITERASDKVLAKHVSSFFDLEMIGPQYGLLLGFNASTKEYEIPSHRNAEVEVVTPGVLDPDPPGIDAQDARFYLQLRTVVDKIIIPILGAVLGENAIIKKHLILTLIVQHLYDAVQDFRAALDTGTVSDAVKILLNALARDLDGAGPLTTALASVIAGAAPDAVAAVARRIGAKAIPIVGQISAVIDAIGLIATATNVTKTIVDIATTPGVLTFDVDFGFEIGRVDPSSLERAYRGATLRVQGVGFRRFDPSSGDRLDPVVTVTDTGGRVAAIMPSPEALAHDGTSFEVDLPAVFVAEARGPLSVTVRFGADEETAYGAVAIHSDLRLTEITPQTGAPGEQITLFGSGFGYDVREAKVWFHGLDGTGAPVALRATTLAVEPSRIDLIVPAGVISGAEFQVEVEVGPTALTFRTNRLPFNAQFRTLAGLWHFAFDYQPCYDPPRHVEFIVNWVEPGPPWGNKPASGDTYLDLNGRQLGCSVGGTYSDNPSDPLDYGLVRVLAGAGSLSCEEGGTYYGLLSPDGQSIHAVGRSSTTSEFTCGVRDWPPPTVVGTKL